MQQPVPIEGRTGLLALPDLRDPALRACDSQLPQFGSDAPLLEECMRELDALLASLGES